MLEPLGPRPDDTVELPAVPARRPTALMVAAGVVAVGVLVGVGFLAFSDLGGDAGGHQSAGGLPAISPSAHAVATPSTSPTAAPATTPAPATTRTTGTPAATPPPGVAVPVRIVNATMKPAGYQGAGCPGSTTAVATVVANAPVTITYRWTSTRTGSAPGDTARYTFAAAGSHQFRRSFTNIMTPAGQFAAVFTVVSPVQRRASMIYTQKCGASASKVSVKPSSTPCQVTFAATIHAGVGPMTVGYRWELGPTSTGGNGQQTWIAPRGGGSTDVMIKITVPKGGTVTARLVLDTPIRFATAPKTAACP